MKEDIKLLLEKYKDTKSSYYRYIDSSEKSNLYDMSFDQFNTLNRSLRNVPIDKRKKFMNSTIINSMNFKLHLQGYTSTQIERLNKIIYINWSKIIENHVEIKAEDLILSSKEQLDRQEEKLKSINILSKNEKDRNIKLIANSILMITACSIATTDLIYLYKTKNPTEYALNSFAISLTPFASFLTNLK